MVASPRAAPASQSASDGAPSPSATADAAPPEPAFPRGTRVEIPGLVDAGALVPDARVELKYATADNFLGRDVYGGLDRCLLVPDAAKMLAEAARLLRERAPGSIFVLYDCARPLRVQRAMWRLVEGTPQEPYVADPNTPTASVHNRGCAVDLTLGERASGAALDMGTPFDFFGPAAEPRREIELWEKGELSSAALANRLLLRELMLRAGFRLLPNEWWHFDCADSATARARYPLIE